MKIENDKYLFDFCGVVWIASFDILKERCVVDSFISLSYFINNIFPVRLCEAVSIV